MTAVTSRQNPIVSRYRAAARGDARDRILLDGAHLVADAIAAGVTIDEAAITAAAADDRALQQVRSALQQSGVEVTTVSASVMDALSPVRTSSGIVALGRRPRAEETRIYGRARPLVVIAIDVQDPGNIGAMVRVAEAAGADGVVASGACADPFGWKALRGSMGSALRLPIVVAPNGPEAVTAARRHGCRIVATAPRGGHSLFAVDLDGPIALLIGGEGAGLDPIVLDEADERVTIPMQAPVESLNTAVAAALLLYEARRQRHS